MSTIEDIQRAVEQLPPADFARFQTWFAQLKAARFDRRIEQSAAAGRLDALADAALADCREGAAHDL